MSTQPTQRIAVIDLGSNTVRLVVLRAIPGFAYRLEDQIREVVRLRQGMGPDGLSEQAIARAFFTLRLFKQYCDSVQVDHIIATATSAVREAENGRRFVARVKSEIGLDLHILDGEREAYYATIGVLNELPIRRGFVVDIGGGSVQIAAVRDKRFQRGVTMPLGALALTERFVQHDPVAPAELEAIRAEIKAHLDGVSWLNKKKVPAGQLMGLGGTIRNLANVEAKRQSYPLKTLHGFGLTLASVQETVALLCERPLAERQKLRGLNKDRADIILPGALVIEAIMLRLQKERLTISINGLREGLFLEYFWAHLAYPVLPNVRQFGVLNMARIYNYQKKHANHVRFLTGRLFDQLAPLHGYGALERELLGAAALLHDLGGIISYHNHHKHSQTLIINSGLAGYTPREVALIALLTRYHRKGRPRVNGFESVLQEGDEQRLLRLAALLRLAEFLERGRNGTVDDVTAVWDDDTLRLTLMADNYPAVELWEAERSAADLVSLAFDREVILESTAVPDDWILPDS